MKDNGKMIRKMDMGPTYGKIKQNMKENGKKTQLKDMGCIILVMAEYTLVNGRIIKCMAMGSFYGKKEKNTMASTHMIRRMALECVLESALESSSSVASAFWTRLFD